MEKSENFQNFNKFTQTKNFEKMSKVVPNPLAVAEFRRFSKYFDPIQKFDVGGNIFKKSLKHCENPQKF